MASKFTMAPQLTYAKAMGCMPAFTAAANDWNVEGWWLSNTIFPVSGALFVVSNGNDGDMLFFPIIVIDHMVGETVGEASPRPMACFRPHFGMIDNISDRQLLLHHKTPCQTPLVSCRSNPCFYQVPSLLPTDIHKSFRVPLFYSSFNLFTWNAFRLPIEVSLQAVFGFFCPCLFNVRINRIKGLANGIGNLDTLLNRQTIDRFYDFLGTHDSILSLVG
jgi:ribosomal protein S19